ncbi:MAG: transposase [Lachnoclostridium sp.]|nr:transposase [Lachnoclostridium sp.]
MRKLLRSYKTELKPTVEQKQAIDRTIGVCRFVYNFYIAHNKEIYEKENRFVTGIDFSVWLNNEFIPNHPDYTWIREVSSKAVKQSIMDADSAFRRFFKHQAGFPKFKKKGVNEPKMYFVKTDKKAVIRCERHRIKIPTIGWVRLKEKGYIPTDPEKYVIRSGAVSKRAGRYYVSVLVETDEVAERPVLTKEGLGIDLGLKEFAALSNGDVFRNINKSSAIKKLEKKLKREQKALSRKLEAKKRNQKNQEGGSYSNIEKQKLKVQRLHQRLENTRTDYLNKCVYDMVKTKPSYITIENLNVRGMMKNRHLSKAVANQKFYEFRTKLSVKCKENGIELRIVNTWYPSSKMCHRCGNLKRDLKLSDRVFCCPHCGAIIDRDLNAALNLRDAKVYEIAA